MKLILPVVLIAGDLVTYGGKAITEDFFRKAVASTAGEERQALEQDPMFRRQYLEKILAMKLLAQEAEATAVDKDPEVAERLQVARDQILAEAVMRRLDKEKMTEAALKDFFEEHKAIFSREAHVQHAVFSTRAKAEEVMLAAMKPGVDFMKLIQPFVAEGKPELGGDLGYRRRGRMPEAFEDAVFATAPGTIHGGVVKTELGWHVIKAINFRSETDATLAEMRPVVVAAFQNKIQLRLIEDLKKKAKVKVDEGAVNGMKW